MTVLWVDLLLLALFTLRLSRLVTSDHLGRWFIQEPADEWADRATLLEEGRRLASERESLIAAGVDPAELDVPLAPETEGGEEWFDDDEPQDWRHRLVEGVKCAFCEGFWLGLLAILSLVAVRDWWPDNPVEWWRLTVAPFALNYVVGHVSARLDG